METRDSFLVQIRPKIESSTLTTTISEEEFFQNKTLRPIIQLQNDLLIEVFKHYIKKHKNVFYDLSIEKRLDYVDNAIHKDMKFRNSIKGIIIGQFTIAEHKQYVFHSSSLNKRIMRLVKERIKSNIQILQFAVA